MKSSNFDLARMLHASDTLLLKAIKSSITIRQCAGLRAVMQRAIVGSYTNHDNVYERHLQPSSFCQAFVLAVRFRSKLALAPHALTKTCIASTYLAARTIVLSHPVLLNTACYIASMPPHTRHNPVRLYIADDVPKKPRAPQWHNTQAPFSSLQALTAYIRQQRLCRCSYPNLRAPTAANGPALPLIQVSFRKSS